jgi:hypothetical protein
MEVKMHANLRTGCSVLTADGDQLGTVKEVRGDYFKVDAPMATDYWLACDAVAGETGDAVRVHFTKDMLDQNKYAEPARI